ncbi:uncharacterized protein LY79DRAFT_508278 [Colletotrichum navitas]|uniref:DUF1772 domain-containing protein n=1 Tax=Colletotrichum navitas TaxID=681940 RepID=A0AAD8Q7G1_9PEZI|nr:uncharacterized protein LY79DRAFT_508278 [Colletotrichum navitas]KAK1597115.1 hypothetical protein LY79DRAFT_508278 [Colletotrichum navitas]
MSSQPNPLRGIQSSTVFVNTALAGLNLSLSVFVVPRLLESPTPLMLRQWSSMFARTSRVFPPPILTCALSYWYMAYQTAAHHHHLPGASGKSRLLAVAGALCFAIVPWTKFLMVGINRELLRRAEGTRDMGIMAVGMTHEEQEGAKSLVDRWGLYNLGRSIALGLGGAVGLYTIVSS